MTRSVGNAVTDEGLPLDLDAPKRNGRAMKSEGGILPGHEIAALVATGAIAAERPVVDGQIQPASLDLRLGARAWRVRASFLPGPHRKVAECLAKLNALEVNLDNEQGAVLERNCVYIAEVEESLALSSSLSAAANPKSSTGRLDVFTRVITDRADRFDIIKEGYAGKLYAEVSPRTFPVLARRGSRLAQLRLRNGEARLDDDKLAELHERETLVAGLNPSFAAGIAVSVDLAGTNASSVIGYRAKNHTGLIDVDRRSGYVVDEFWEAIPARPDRSLILDPGEFYILASKEAVQVPPDYAAEMVPFDPLVGEFRVHYAGFFDPGFGHAAAGGHGSRAVLEVRSRDVPFILEDGQTVARLVYERLTERPNALYGTELGSYYQAQGLKLSKHFRARVV